MRKNKELLCHTRAEEDEGAIFHAHAGGTTRKIGHEGQNRVSNIS
jgi:hypothetical protein